MDWMVLYWNVRGLNDKDKRLAVYNKIEESNCSVVCLQETKCHSFDHSFIRSFCPKRFDRFAFSPSICASGGIIVLWNSSIFNGEVLEIHRSAVRIKFSSLIIISFGSWFVFMALALALRGTLLFNGCVIWTSLCMITGFCWEISTS
jgi:hypothetical protein